MLDDYDKTVRPVLGNKTVIVSFGMKISRLVKVVSILLLKNIFSRPLNLILVCNTFFLFFSFPLYSKPCSETFSESSYERQFSSVVVSAGH